VGLLPLAYINAKICAAKKEAYCYRTLMSRTLAAAPPCVLEYD